MFPLDMPDCNRRVITSEQVTLKPQGEREEEETEWGMKDANEHQVFIVFIAQPANTTTAQSPSAED